MATKPVSSRWYPSQQQLKDPQSMESAMRQVLTQHYALQDKFDALSAKVNAPPAKSDAPLPGHGPSDTMLLGLHVLPVDTSALADGAKLTWTQKDGNFQIK